MIAPIPRKRSLADMQHTDGTLPAEYSDVEYAREVLQLEDGQTEEGVDQGLTKAAEKLGIRISRPSTPNGNPHISMCDSAITVGSHHARTGSTGSEESSSTGMTSRSSNEQLDSSTPPHAQKKSTSRRSLSFSEYEKYLAQTEAQGRRQLGVQPASNPLRTRAITILCLDEEILCQY